MMWKDFLEDYQKAEIERQQKHYKYSLDTVTRFAPIIGYPSSSRFRKINRPMVLADTSSYVFYDEKIWSQVPFAGSSKHIPFDWSGP